MHVASSAGIFFDKFPLQEFFLGNCHPTSGYISNGPSLTDASM